MLRRKFFKTFLTISTTFPFFLFSRKSAQGDIFDLFLGDRSKSSSKFKKNVKLSSKSRVVISQSSEARNSNGRLRKEVARKIISESLKALTGEKDAGTAWKVLFNKDDVVGIKLNCLAGRGLSPRKEIVDLIIEGLKLAGLEDEQIIVWDKADTDLQKAGYTISYYGRGIKYYGTNNDYESEPEISGSIGSCFSRIISKKCTAIINVPVLKDHDLAGVSIGMKNFYGAIHNPNKYHDGNCNPYVADLNSHPYIKDKLRLIICDAITAQFHGGPAYNPQWVWNFNGIIMATDPVALDKIGAEIIKDKRKEKGLPSFKKAKREPKYIETAADLKLGNCDFGKIEVVRV